MFSKHQRSLQNKHCTFNSDIPSKPQVCTTGGCPGVFQVQTTTFGTNELSCHQHTTSSEATGPAVGSAVPMESGASDGVSFAVKAVHGTCIKEFLFVLETHCGQTVFTGPAWWASKQDCDLHARILMQAHRCARDVTVASSQIVQGDNRSVLLCPPEAVFLLHSVIADQGLVVFVPFAGGVSGWTQASKLLTSVGIPCRVAAACDSCFDACVAYSKMHRIAMIPIRDLGPAHAAAPVVVHTDVRTPKIWTFASLLDTNCVTLSWPCQSFANSGGGSGWHDTVTSIFNGALRYCQLAKVPILLLENVPPVWEKSDFSMHLPIQDHAMA